MTLTEVLELHPGEGADTATLSEALAAAEAKRDELLQQAKAADGMRAEGMLAADDKALFAEERKGAQARLAAERIEALLAQLQADHAAARDREAAARGQEEVAELRADAAEVDRLIAELEHWQAEEWPKVLKMIGAGLWAERRVAEAYAALLKKAGAAFQSQAVRDAAPEGLNVAQLPARRPSHDFPGWRV